MRVIVTNIKPQLLAGPSGQKYSASKELDEKNGMYLYVLD